MLWHVWEVERYALSKFQSPTMLGDPKTIEKMIGQKIDLFGLGNQFFERPWSVRSKNHVQYVRKVIGRSLYDVEARSAIGRAVYPHVQK